VTPYVPGTVPAGDCPDAFSECAPALISVRASGQSPFRGQSRGGPRWGIGRNFVRLAPGQSHVVRIDR